MKGGYFVKVYEIIYVQIEEHYVCIWEAIRKIKISVSLLYSNDWTMSYEKYSVYYAIDVAKRECFKLQQEAAWFRWKTSRAIQPMVRASLAWWILIWICPAFSSRGINDCFLRAEKEQSNCLKDESLFRAIYKMMEHF